MSYPWSFDSFIRRYGESKKRWESFRSEREMIFEILKQEIIFFLAQKKLLLMPATEVKGEQISFSKPQTNPFFIATLLENEHNVEQFKYLIVNNFTSTCMSKRSHWKAFVGTEQVEAAKGEKWT